MTNEREEARAAQQALIDRLPDLLDEDKKAASLKRLERALAAMDEDLVDEIDAVTSAIEEYREAERDDKASAWADVVSAVEDLALIDEDEEDAEPEGAGEPVPPAAPPARPPEPTALAAGGRDPDDRISIGQWFRGQFVRAGTKGASPADLYKTLRSQRAGEAIDYRGGTYSSFFREFWWLKQVKYVERTGRTAPSFQRGRKPGDRKGGAAGFAGVLKSPKVFYRLTKTGRESDPTTWENLTALVHADRLEPFWWRQYQPLTGRPRGRPAQEWREGAPRSPVRPPRRPGGTTPGEPPLPAVTEGRRRVKLPPEQEVSTQLSSLRDGIRGLAVQWTAAGAADLLAKTTAAGRLLANRIDPLESLEDTKKPLSPTQRTSLDALRGLVESYDEALELVMTFARQWAERGPSTAGDRDNYNRMLGRIVRSLPAQAGSPAPA